MLVPYFFVRSCHLVSLAPYWNGRNKGLANNL
jgi:hypothetical protein